MSKKKSANTFRVTLLRDGHEHAGRKLKAGTVIEVNGVEKAWLEVHGIIAPPANNQFSNVDAQSEGGAQ